MNNYLFDNLIYFRKKNGLSQEDLANKINVSRQTVSRWECGEAMPSTENMIELSALYGVTIDELIQQNFSAEDDKKEEQTYEAEIIDPIPSKLKAIGRKILSLTSLTLVICAISALIATTAFMLIGFFIPGSWSVAWLCFLSIPLAASIALSIKTRKVSLFCFPLIALTAFYAAGWLTHMWHPLWLIFLTIPLYYCVSTLIDIAIAKRNRKNDADNVFN